MAVRLALMLRMKLKKKKEEESTVSVVVENEKRLRWFSNARQVFHLCMGARRQNLLALRTLEARPVPVFAQ